MQYKRMPIEVESPEQMGYDKIRNNLSESSYTDTWFKSLDISADLHQLILAYGPHAGHEGIRHLIARENTRFHADPRPFPHPDPDPNAGPDTGRNIRLDTDIDQLLVPNATSPGHSIDPAPLTSDDVLLTIGAAGGLFIISTTLLERGDEMIVIRPNYATNIETPKAIGAAIKYVDLVFEEDFTLNIKKIKDLLTKHTRYISVTYPHNPTGACLTEGELKDLINLAEQNNTRLLVDETYRDMTFGEQLPLAATYSPHVISISSLSKTYGLPGIRVGWIVCRDRELMETFLAAKEQIHICGSVLDEEVAFRYLQHKQRHLRQIQKDIRNKFDLIKEWIEQQKDFEWIEPKGGCVCFPRICEPVKVDLDKFYNILLQKYRTYTGPGHWFDMPRHYMRVGFGWPTINQLQQGLEGLSQCISDGAVVK